MFLISLKLADVLLITLTQLLVINSAILFFVIIFSIAILLYSFNIFDIVYLQIHLFLFIII